MPAPTTRTREQLLKDLKTHCVRLSSDAIKPKIDPASFPELRSALESIHSTLKQMTEVEGLINLSVADYVFFPIHFIFAQEQGMSDRVLELALQCINVLLDHPWRNQMKPDVAGQMFMFLTVMVGGSPLPGAKREQKSEECLGAAVSCLNSLFQAMTPGNPAAKVFDDAKLLPSIGHAVLSLLELLCTAESADLQAGCLTALESLIRDVIEPDALLTFLPGTVSQLCKFLAPNSQKKRPYRNLVSALRLLSQSIVKVLNDRENADLPDIKQLTSPAEQKVVRSKAWLSATVGQIKIAMEAIARLRTHKASAVRKAQLRLCQDMLDNCSTTLKDCIPLFVDNLVVFAGDEDVEIAVLANSTLLFAAGMDGEVKDCLQESVHRWATSLPRIMQANDEAAKEKVIRRICAGLEMMNNLGINSEIVVDLLLQNTFESLHAISEFNRDRQILTATDTAEVESSMELVLSGSREIDTPKDSFPEIIMPHKSQKETLESLKGLLRDIGYSSRDARALVRRSLNRIHGESDSSRAVSLWTTINLLRGAIGEMGPECDTYLTFVPLEDLIDRQISDELLSASLEILSNSETEDAPSEKLQCLAVEAVTLVAQARGKPFKFTFVESLYPIVHLLGSFSPLVQNHAVVALNLIAKATGYENAQVLVVKNSDYLLNAISLKLSFSELSPQAPLVLRMLLKISGSALIPHLDDVVGAIFSALDSYHGYEQLVATLFSVLEAVCEEGAKSLEGVVSEKEMIEKRIEEQRLKPLTKQQVLDMFSKAFTRNPDDEVEERDPHPQKPWGKGKGKEKYDGDPFADLDEEDEETSKELQKQEAEPKPSKIYATMLRIVQLTPQYLSSPSPILRARLLSLLSVTIPALATRENDFLPIVHLVWPIVSLRLTAEPDANVRREAARTMRALCLYAGDFVRGRVKDGWEKYQASAIKENRIGVLEGFVLVGAEVDNIVASLGEEVIARYPVLRKAVTKIGGWVIEAAENATSTLKLSI